MNEHPDLHHPDLHFDTLLAAVLHEQANPAVPTHLTFRLTQALSRQSGASPMTTTYDHTSILWSGPQPRTRWHFRSLFTAALVHAAVILLIAFVLLNRTHILSQPVAPAVTLLETPRIPRLPKPSPTPPRAQLMAGGGGHAGATPIPHGTPPPPAAQQLDPPKLPPLAEPKVEVPVTLDMQLNFQKSASPPLPQPGLTALAIVGRDLGMGKGTGLASGNGAGLGAGAGGNTGGGVLHVGGGVSAPIPTYQPEPEFSDQARKAKVAGNVLVYLQVDEQGHPQHVRVLRGIGLGLDEKAIAAVQQYRFKPALKDGHPVTVEMNIDVLFQIF